MRQPMKIGGSVDRKTNVNWLIVELSTLNYGGLAQLARAPALQAGGHRFESDILHFFKGKKVGEVEK